MQKANVHKVMKEIGLETDPDTQHLEVWNKIDLMGAPALFSSTFPSVPMP
jgi:50S ribosomal subunit-associated GTPase HflX